MQPITMRRLGVPLAAFAVALAVPGTALAKGGGGVTTVPSTLASITASPSTIPGGSDATGKATFTAPTVDGAVLNISSSDTAVARVPAQTVVVRGASTGAFDIATSAVAAPTQVTITVTSFGVTRTTAITVTPDPLPAPDTVTIKKAECKVQNNGCLVSVEATSSNPDAILGVYSSSGLLLFTLTNNGGGRYSGSRGFTDDPRTLEVRSNFRGSAVATNL